LPKVAIRLGDIGLVAGLGRKPRTPGRECQRVKHYDTILFMFSMPGLWLLFLKKTLLVAMC